MICHHVLPDGYGKIKSISFTKDKKLYTRINAAAIAAAVFLVMIMRIFVPFDFYTPSSYGEVKEIFIKCGVLFVSALAYVILHEAVHGVFIRIISGKWGKFGFNSSFAYASSAAFFGRYEYITIALAPIVIWGIVLGIQVINLSGAVGDIYVTYTVMKLPKESLFKDDGLDITVYSKTVLSEGKE